MNFLNKKTQWTQKNFQKFLEERGLLPAKVLNLSCLKPKYFYCQVAADCKIFVKGYKCDICKLPRQFSSLSCLKNCQFDEYLYREEICQYVSTKYCAVCTVKKEKCGDCKDFLSAIQKIIYL